jgi:hypothetical protein
MEAAAVVSAHVHHSPVTAINTAASTSFIDIQSFADPEQAVKAGTLICEEDSGGAVVLAHKLNFQFPIVTATWDRRLHAAAAAAMAADRAAKLSAAVRALYVTPACLHVMTPHLSMGTGRLG